MTKVSVIVPVYNVAPYLRRALDSLLSQDIEVICIDDGSTDGSGDILDSYKGIRVIKFPENRGVSAARNSGLEIANGKYIGFCDPDDYVDNDFYARLYNAAENSGCDITLGNAICLTHEGTFENRTQLLKDIELNKFALVYNFWAAIYRRDFIEKHNIRFPEGIICGQDLVFLNRAVTFANAIKTVPDTFYHYMTRPNSSYAPILSYEKIVSQINARNIILEFMNSVPISGPNYVFVWDMLFRNIIVTFYERNTNPDTHKMLADKAIEFYWAAKFKDGIIIKLNATHPALYPILESRDTGGMVNWMRENHEKKRVMPRKKRFLFHLTKR